jgi:hypothetical protein
MRIPNTGYLRKHNISSMLIIRFCSLYNNSRYILGINITNGEEVAVKLESVKARHPQLLYESKLYKILQVGYVGTAVQQCCGSGIFIMDPDIYPSRIPVLGSRIQQPNQKRRGKKFLLPQVLLNCK